MSAKWRRSQAWDEANIPRALAPVKWVLRAFSSIGLAVLLLSTVALYGVIASVPIGLLAKAPTYLLYFAALAVTAVVIGGAPTALAWYALRRRGRGTRFVACFASMLVFGGLGVLVWLRYAWPAMHWDPATGRGLMLFSGFIREFSGTTIRRLPGLEMSELEFYAWWPLRVVLLLFVLNLVTATLRRIEFDFKHMGVLMVHTGIVLIALGSVYYNGLKKEGDTVLLAADTDPRSGRPGADAGPSQRTFYDNTDVALFLDQFRGWEQRPLRDVPRYNDYNLGAIAGESAWEASGRRRPWEGGARRTLGMDVPAGRTGFVDTDLHFRVVGYASYAQPAGDWVKVDLTKVTSVAPWAAVNPLRIVYLLTDVPDDSGSVSSDPVFAFTFPPMQPALRHSGNELIAIEYTLGPRNGMTEERWRDLSETLPEQTRYALVVEVPGVGGGAPFRQVSAVEGGESLAIGDTGFSVDVKQLAEEPPFPIITEGYRGATSSVAVVTITPPASIPGGAFDRWIYHRYPEINQDMLQEVNDRGMPKRRDADPMIRVALVEANRLNIYFDEPAEGKTRVLIRHPGGAVRVVDDVAADDLVRDIAPKLHVRVGQRWDHAARTERPSPVPPSQQDRSFIGTHDKAMLAVEVSSDKLPEWKYVAWLPFTKYMGLNMGTERAIDLPDGRRLNLAFGRRQHPLPGFEIQLVDFQMIAYDHRGAPRDYQSVVKVTPTGDGPEFDQFVHYTKLNDPLWAPFHWSEDRGLASNVLGRVQSGLSPNQYKFSQAGWDRDGWEQTQKMADEGLIDRPRASFTILGVGNNPGIHIIAVGGVLMGFGIPWAFYLKPYLVRREKRRIQEQLARGEYKRPARSAAGEKSAEAVGAGT